MLVSARLDGKMVNVSARLDGEMVSVSARLDGEMIRVSSSAQRLRPQKRLLEKFDETS